MIPGHFIVVFHPKNILKLTFLMSVLNAVVEFLPDGLSYYPILYFNDYWNLNQDYMPINSSTKSVITATHMLYTRLSLIKKITLVFFCSTG